MGVTKANRRGHPKNLYIDDQTKGIFTEYKLRTNRAPSEFMREAVKRLAENLDFSCVTQPSAPLIPISKLMWKRPII